ncbi:MAG: aldolase catalytic domain-containing protein [Lachnospiraceae bacterium]|nr:aldolase catalytic domain-containing protein [Lachnospiraceae bacterium]
MGTIKLLDCTLRDGGYVNDWKFGQKNLISVFERLTDAGVDIIEIGFLDERRPFDIDRSIMPDTACVNQIFGSLDKKQAMVVGMIDYGTCGIKNLQPCEDCFLDGIRVIFKKHLMVPAMEFCRQVKALGYRVFAQLVSITSYNDEELSALADLVNDVKPYAVSMVDTYGLLHPEDLLHYYEILDRQVCPEVQIGFHAHNNFQLAYANALAFLGKEARHDIVVDGTLYGMGKSAGNAPLELLGMRLNDRFGGHYRIDPMLEAIKESVMDFYETSPWGYKTFFYLCGRNNCHPNYVTYLEAKKNLSVSKIDALLAQIEPEEKKLLYDKLVAEKLYDDYLSGEGNDADAKEAFREELSGRTVLTVGPGKNILLQQKAVKQFCEKNRPYVISINYIPEFMDVDCVFVTNGKRYHDMVLSLKQEKNQNVKLLATSNVECRNGQFDFVMNRAPLLENEERITDNSFLMLLKFFRMLKIDEVYCAGFDGYSDKEDNYCNPAMEYSFVKREALHLNYHMKKRITELRENMKIHFITYSAYDVVEDINGAAI